MKYKVEEENRTKIYHVKMNIPKLKELVVDLDKYCYVRRLLNKIQLANDDEELETTIKNRVNAANMPVNESYRIYNVIREFGRDQEACFEVVSKESVRLVDLIKAMIYCEENKKCAIDEDTKKIIELKGYGESKDFEPFTKQVEDANNRVNGILCSEDHTKLLDAVHEYSKAVVEAKLNDGYDFNKLRSLYEEVLKCFDYELEEETIRYNVTK